MATRSTYPVKDLREHINRLLQVTADNMVRERTALAIVLESTLMETGNYRGFQYVDAKGQYTTPLANDFDDSRRHYN